MFDQVTDQVRRAAMVWKANKFNNVKREEVISNAQLNWEMMKTQISRTQLSSNLKDTVLEEIIPLSESLPLAGKAVQMPKRCQVKRNDILQRRSVSQQVCI